MAKAGRPQGEPRGMTGASNDLARFLQKLTDGVSLRELAESYEGGKTLWGEYRSGAQIIPLSRLNSVIRDRVRDARGREVMLAKARELHGLALTAEVESQPDMGLGEALQQAEKDIADMSRLIKVLLGRIDVLQEQAAQPAAATGEVGDPPAGPVETITAQLEALRQHVAAAQQVRDATRKAYDEAQSEVPVRRVLEGGANGADSPAQPAGGGAELVGSLVRLHDSATRRRQDALLLWEEDGEDGAGAAPDDAPDGPRGVDGPVLEGGSLRVSGAKERDPDGIEKAGGEGQPAEVGEGRDSSAREEDRRRSLLRLPAGAALVLLIAVSVAGGMVISRYQGSPSDPGGSDTRLNAPTVPTRACNTPTLGLPVLPGPDSSASSSPTPSASGAPSKEPTAKPKPSAKPSPPKASPSKEKPKAPGPAAPQTISTEPRAWINAGTQMCLEIRASSGEDGATANQWTCNNSSSQKWITTNPGGVTTLVSMDSGKCLEFRGDSVETGATANQWTCNHAPSSQNWNWQPAAGGGWSLVNANSGKCLSVRLPGDGVLADQQPCDGTPFQTWY
ncbi:RICIN domain-containing protein [Streptomyces sp. NPDC006487]|uniref:RICIN domain-containing protein n=1 Tax=Streptomyces sp. NPDC006487 TaxID=3364748 RepID=UPI0036999754